MPGRGTPESFSLRSAGTRLARRVRNAFRERQILLRSGGEVTYLRLTPRIQVYAVFGLFVVGGWMAAATAGYMVRGYQLSARTAEAEVTRRAFVELRGQVAYTRQEFQTAADLLSDNHRRLLSYLDQNLALKEELALLAPEGDLDGRRDAIAAARGELTTLMDEGDEVSVERAGGKATGPLAALLGDKFDPVGDHGSMFLGLSGVSRDLRDLRASQEGILARFAERTSENITRAEKTIEMTGLDVDNLLLALEGNRSGSGQGGPFIPVSGASGRGDEGAMGFANIDMRTDRWDELRAALRQLPLLEPSDHYYVSSAFGKRRDPVNNRWAVHYGADLAGIRRSPVLATAPGVVAYAGRNGRYGRLVEIDHGNGVRTRYGHLDGIKVQTGQKVGFRDIVGLMGSSGRSTGVHLHYEILVNGEPQDPLKFMKAGRYVFQG